MGALSFRVKLLLTMMLVVVGATAASLYVTERNVNAAYERLFQEQFQSEVNYFASQQEARVAAVKDAGKAVAGSAGFQKAMATGDHLQIYAEATNVLRGQAIFRLPRFQARVDEAAGGGAAPLRRDLFLRVLDANGVILHPREARAGSAIQANRDRMDHPLNVARDGMAKLDETQVGYITERERLVEVTVTKVTDPETQEIRGAIVLGTAYQDSSLMMKDLSRIENGIWLENQLYSRTIPEQEVTNVTKAVANRITGAGRTNEAFTIELVGAPQRVFFRLLNPDSIFPPAYQVSFYSLADARRAEKELAWQIIAVGVLAVLIALLLSMVLAHGLSTPLRELVAGTSAIRAGNFDVKVPVRGRDELGELASSFNEMAEGLAQKERYRTVLNMVADEKVARELVEGQLALGGELREITVLFCDIRGFTPLTRGMPPEEVIDMLNEHMTALTGIVKEHNGVLDKFVGDLLMAIFGAPVAGHDDALNAVRCALRLIAQREELNTTSRHQLRIGIGIATGKAVAGCMGSSDRLNYTVLGERVNLGSRLCGQAGPGQVIIDETTRGRVGDKITVRPLGNLNLKGFSDAVVAYELTEVLSWEIAGEQTE
jgi:class 3 adenylate cyclase